LRFRNLLAFALFLCAFAYPQIAKADGATCAYTAALATVLNVPTCNSAIGTSANALNVNVISGGGTATVTFPYSGTTSGQTATIQSFLGAGGIYNSSAPTLTNGQFAPVQLDASGNLKVNVVTGGGSTGGSVTAAGTNGTVAQAIQGITGGIAVPVSGTFYQATQPVSIATTVPVSLATSVPVTGNFYQATQPVSIATTVPVSLAGSVTTIGSGAAGTPATGVQTIQGITGMTPIAVSGTVTSSGLWPISGSNSAAVNQTAATGDLVTDAGSQSGSQTLTANGSVIIPVGGYAGLAFNISGTWTGTFTFTADDGSGTFPWSQMCTGNAPGGVVASTTVNNSYTCNIAPHANVKLALTSFAGTSATINWHTGGNPGTTSIIGSAGQVISNANPSGQNYSSTGSLFTASFGELYSGGSNSWDSQVESSSNIDGFKHNAGIVATTQNSTGGNAPIACDSSYAIDNITTAGTTTAVTYSTTKNIYVCGISLQLGASTTAKLQSSSSATCGSGTTDITGAYAASTNYGGAIGTILAPLATTRSLCLVVTGTGGVNGIITYSQF
jgi:hypothetical protein